jgi:hypothetical protein
MTKDELIDSMSEFFETFGASLSTTQWSQYWEALQDLNPGDIDDAMHELRRTHQYHNAPLPYEIRVAAQSARRRRIIDTPDEPLAGAEPHEGELKTITLRDGTTMNIRVLPDGHHSLPKRHCVRCDDSGFVLFQRQAPIWMYGPNAPLHEYTERCHCTPTNPIIQKRREQNAAHAITITKSRGKE